MTLWADVSEWQTGITDAYPHRMVCIRSNDGTYRDKKWANNYGWCKAAADDGRLDCFIVYMVYRTNWQQTFDTFKAMVGTPHPKMIAMVDVESWGGQIGGNQSAGINGLIAYLGTFLGDQRRVIAYGNRGDLESLWPSKPNSTRLIVAGYSSSKPNYPNQIGWQYTDGSGYGPSGWPQGAPPFGTCDMNYTDLSTTDFAAQCGVTKGFLMTLNEAEQKTVWTGAAQIDKGSSRVRRAAKWLIKYLPPSFDWTAKDYQGVWVRDEIDALVNEIVTGQFTWHPNDTIDFEDGKGPIKLIDIPPTQEIGMNTLLRIIAARLYVQQGGK
ncbi:hypothetical protein LH935_06955 [Gordonia polyisoprenivorans]|uniref:hypothetical protein n=1 Tax=Gordonia polyisoprenivorans TaxID=84595 RepID=UPI002234AF98|nr:hypothetical protein LH935_06955 [Gordonia polyisoprenivorans]